VQLETGGALEIAVPALASESTAAVASLQGLDGRRFRSPGWSRQVQGEWRLSAGRATIRGVPLGDWNLIVAAADGRQWQQRVSVGAGRPTQVELH
jgi:hypothetical protein